MMITAGANISIAEPKPFVINPINFDAAWDIPKNSRHKIPEITRTVPVISVKASSPLTSHVTTTTISNISNSPITRKKILLFFPVSSLEIILHSCEFFPETVSSFFI